MILLNPKQHRRPYPDARSTEVMRATIEFFETKGKTRLLADYYDRVWYADFLAFVKEHRIFTTMCTPAGEGAPDARWDTWRICEFAEILGFYGLQYWYTWQVADRHIPRDQILRTSGRSLRGRPSARPAVARNATSTSLRSRHTRG